MHLLAEDVCIGNGQTDRRAPSAGVTELFQLNDLYNGTKYHNAVD